MPTYIVLYNYTQQGINKIDKAPARAAEARKAFKKAGARLKADYLTMGQYDGVAIIEAPDEETVAKIMLSAGRKGNISTQTMRAFTEKEYKKLVKGL